MAPASEGANSAAGFEPTSSITARTSSIRCSRAGSSESGTRSDSPVPRLSKKMRREKDASRRRKRATRGFLPEVLDVGDEPRHKDEVALTLPHHLVRNVDIATLCVPRLRLHHARHPTSQCSPRPE